MTSVTGDFTATVDAPAYSVVALSLTAGQANTAPTVALTVRPQSGMSPLTVSVDTSGSYDTDGSIVSRTIDFGDGSTPATSVTATHSYTEPRTYMVQATVVDNGGLSSQAIASVTASSSADFNLTASAIAGIPDSFTVTVTPVRSLNASVSFSCAQAPPSAMCVFSPASFRQRL